MLFLGFCNFLLEAVRDTEGTEKKPSPLTEKALYQSNFTEEAM